MASTTRLLVLGVVRIFQPVHGYEIRRELVTWRAQEWASIKAGSIYNALKALTRDGYLEVVGMSQVGGRPERTMYRLTAAGDEEFRILLREAWWTVRPPMDPLMAAISFTGFFSRDEAIAALEQRTAQIHGMVRHVAFGIEAHDGKDSPHHVREMMRLMNARILAEVAWAKQFIERLRAGEYSTADDPPWQPASLASKVPSSRSSKPRTGKPAKARAARPRTVARAGRTARPRPNPEHLQTGRNRDLRGVPTDRTRSSEPGPRSRAARRKAVR
jgi:DNA-binding PadR family transcriptional regulator